MVIKKIYADETRHARTKAVYSEYNADLEKSFKSRKNQVTLAQILSGQRRALRAFTDKLDVYVPPRMSMLWGMGSQHGTLVHEVPWNHRSQT